MTDCVLIVDIGTTKVHTNLIGMANGTLVANKAYPYHWIHPAEGWSEVDALGIWEAAQKAVEEIVEASKGKHAIRAIGFSYIGDSLLAVGQDGMPVRNMILAFDNRAEKEAQQIMDGLSEEQLRDVAGYPVRPEWVPAKILWIKNNEPELFKKTAFFLSIQQFINMKLGLGPVTDFTLACRKILFDVRKLNWSEPMSSFLGLKAEQLGGEVYAADSIIGKIRKFGRVDLGDDIPVVLGAHDSEVGMIGLGCIPGSDKVLGNITGTYDHIGYLVKEYVEKLEGFFGSFCGPLKGSFVLMGASIGGPSLDWYINTFNPGEGPAAINRLFDLYPMDGLNKVILSKGVHTGDGTFRGISMTTTQENLFKAIIEGVTFPLMGVMTQLEKYNGRKFGRLRIGGGGAKSDKWSQLKADMFNINVEKVENIEISSMGAAIMAAVGLKYYPNYESAMNSMIGIDRVFTPRPEITQRYSERYREYLEKVC